MSLRDICGPSYSGKRSGLQRNGVPTQVWQLLCCIAFWGFPQGNETVSAATWGPPLPIGILWAAACPFCSRQENSSDGPSLSGHLTTSPFWNMFQFSVRTMRLKNGWWLCFRNRFVFVVLDYFDSLLPSSLSLTHTYPHPCRPSFWSGSQSLQSYWFLKGKFQVTHKWAFKHLFVFIEKWEITKENPCNIHWYVTKSKLNLSQEKH